MVFFSIPKNQGYINYILQISDAQFFFILHTSTLSNLYFKHFSYTQYYYSASTHSKCPAENVPLTLALQQRNVAQTRRPKSLRLKTVNLPPHPRRLRHRRLLIKQSMH